MTWSARITNSDGSKLDPCVGCRFYGDCNVQKMYWQLASITTAVDGVKLLDGSYKYLGGAMILQCSGYEAKVVVPDLGPDLENHGLKEA